MSRNNIKEILTKYKVVAIVGVSRDSSKDSHKVAEYLKKAFDEMLGRYRMCIRQSTDLRSYIA